MTLQQELEAARARVVELEAAVKLEAGRPPVPADWQWIADDDQGPRVTADVRGLELDGEGVMVYIDETDVYHRISTAAVCAFVDYLRQIGKAPPAYVPRREAFTLPAPNPTRPHTRRLG